MLLARLVAPNVSGALAHLVRIKVCIAVQALVLLRLLDDRRGVLHSSNVSGAEEGHCICHAQACQVLGVSEACSRKTTACFTKLRSARCVLVSRIHVWVTLASLPSHGLQP